MHTFHSFLSFNPINPGSFLLNHRGREDTERHREKYKVLKVQLSVSVQECDATAAAFYSSAGTTKATKYNPFPTHLKKSHNSSSDNWAAKIKGNPYFANRTYPLKPQRQGGHRELQRAMHISFFPFF
jgi:hypothetical protein